MSTIAHITALEILDSRGNPTLRATTVTNDGYTGIADVPSGISTGVNEAIELRDGDIKRYGGKGVLTAIQNIHKIIGPKLLGKSIYEQQMLDETMIHLDGTSNKLCLGANAILALSLSIAKAAANASKISLFRYLNQDQSILLPKPMINIINGGQHAQNNLSFQELMICPHGINSFRECLRASSEIFYSLKRNLIKKNYSTSVGDEGGFAPNFISVEEALDCIIFAIKEAGYILEKEVSIGIDCAASSFFREKEQIYKYPKDNLTSDEQVDYLISLTEKYPISSIEDGLAEQDWDGWKKLTEKLQGKVELVGDDLFCTNPSLLKKGIKEKVATSILIKPNQIGTVTETFEVANLARDNGYNLVASHRSGDTEDSCIADIGIAIGATRVKFGSVCRSERTAKYNRLLEIEQELNS